MLTASGKLLVKMADLDFGLPWEATKATVKGTYNAAKFLGKGSYHVANGAAKGLGYVAQGVAGIAKKYPIGALNTAATLAFTVPSILSGDNIYTHYSYF